MTFVPPERLRSDLVAAFSLLVLQGLVALWVRSTGFLAISDDDYARVVIAQKFVEAPTWDPSGTSWLPLPFLLMGATMKLFSASLEVARTFTLVCSCAGTLLLYAAGRRWGTGSALSFAGAATCALLPNSAFLSVATVPEYLTATLVVFGLTSLARPESTGKGEVLGGVCLFLACASRYEAWPAAIAASGIFFLRFWGARSAFSLGAAGLCLLFPVVWLLHGIANHQNALFFIKRVTDYKNALGDSTSHAEAALLYLRALFLAEPEVSCALLATGFLALVQKAPKSGRSTWILPWIPLFAMLTTLVLGALRSGAPTHHEERALLSIWLLGALTTARLLGEVWRRLKGVRVALIVGLLLGLGLRLGGTFEKQPFADRSSEERLGHRLAKLTSPNEKIGLALSDYGYFAVLAAAEYPGRFTIFETHDPREKKHETDSPRARYEASGGCLYVTMGEAPLPSLHSEIERVERWSVRKTHVCRDATRSPEK